MTRKRYLWSGPETVPEHDTFLGLRAIAQGALVALR